MRAFYNEIDQFACAWISNLMDAGLITPGVICDKSIEDVSPTELLGFQRVHFFAGIAGWELALNAAGWGSSPIWTGSCPCQPFSAAGEGAGFADERHLWPAFFHLIKECRPTKIVGEQVASKDANPWVQLVHADLEGLGYSFGAVAFPSAGVGAPHIRDRLYWVGDADHAGLEGHAGNGRAARRKGSKRPVAAAGVPVRLADTDVKVQGGWGIQGPGEGAGASAGATRERSAGLCEAGGEQPGQTNGYWSDADWLLCRDAKWRPVEAGTFPLADGLPRSVGSGGARLAELATLAGLDNASLADAKSYRIGALRGYGNAINVEAAVAFLDAMGVQ